MRRKWKLLAISTICVIMALVAACGGQTSSPSGSSGGGTSSSSGSSGGGSSSSGGSSSTPSPSAAPAEEGPFDPMAPFDPPITVKVGYNPTATDEYNGDETIEKNAWRDLYSQYGINLDIMYVVDISQKDQKLRNAIASGDYPDLFEINSSDLKRYAEAGVLADLTDLYEKYLTPEMEAYYNSDGGVALNATKVGGRLYGLPFIISPWEYIDILWIRKDWLDKLGLEPPKTMSDLEQIALAFTNNDPDGNGINDTYGFAFNGTTPFVDVGDMQAFFAGFNGFPQGYILDDSGDNIIFGGDTPGMIEAFEMLQRLYNAGAIKSDFVTYDRTTVAEDVQNGKAGIWFGPNWVNYYYTSLPKNFPDMDLIAMPIPTQTPGVPAKPYLRSTLGYIHVVSSKHPNPEFIFKMWNLVWDKFNHPDNEERWKYFGGKDAKGVQQYELAIIDARNPNGVLERYQKVWEDAMGIKPADDENLQGAAQLIKDYFDSRQNGTYAPDKNDIDASNWVNKTYYDGGYVTLELVNGKNYTPTGFNGPPTDAMTEYSTALLDAIYTEIIKIITGALPASDWNNFVQGTFMQLGGAQVLKEMNEWLQSTR